MQFQELVPLLLVAGVFGVGQMLEGMVLTPMLVGDKIGLHPVAVIFAVMAGGQLFGFVGVLLALPVAAVIMVLLRHIVEQYTQSNMYHAAARSDVHIDALGPPGTQLDAPGAAATAVESSDMPEAPLPKSEDQSGGDSGIKSGKSDAD